MKTLFTVAVVTASSTAHAAVTQISLPFAGSLQESWESFSNYYDDPSYFMDNPTVIMGGAAQISYPQMVVYQPGYAAFGMNPYGLAQVVDGIKGHGIVNPAAATVIDFLAPIVDFGGYWGATNYHSSDPTVPTPITFDFYDMNGALSDSVVVQFSDSTAGGNLTWYGWQSDTPLSRIVYTGDAVVNDYLQANVPAPGSLAVLALAGAGTRRRR